MATNWAHTPVLLEEVIHHLRLQPGASCLDATINGGGHAAAMLAATAPTGRVLGVDRDPQVPNLLRARFAAEVESGRLQVVTGNFRDLGDILGARAALPLDAVLFDLGISSFHLDASGRGFSFGRDEPLDMRFDPTDADVDTAAMLVAQRDAAALTALFRDYGEERFASRIARAIVARRAKTPIVSTSQLLDVIAAALPANVRWRAARHAARIFQALRIAVNQELDAVGSALPQAVQALAPGGRIAVIAFHSLEDRLVKHCYRDHQRAGALRIITRKPIRPSEAEITANPRAASAKLRVAERL